MVEAILLILIFTTIYLYIQIDALKNNISDLKEIQKCMLERLNKISASTVTEVKTEPATDEITEQKDDTNQTIEIQESPISQNADAEQKFDESDYIKIETDEIIKPYDDKESYEPELTKEEETQRHYNIPKFIVDDTQRVPFETFFAGNILNKIGAVTFILGIGFFLKYAFNNNWINEYMQITLGYLIGAGILWFAYKQQKDESYKVFSQGFAGTGCAVLYLVTYCAYNFYNIFPHFFSFILMVGTTILTFYTAFRFNSLAVAFIGIIGGYLTPFILPSESSSGFGLLLYLVFLSILVSILVYKKVEWRFIESFSHVANLIILLSAMNLLAESKISSFLMVLAIFSSYFIKNFWEFKKESTIRPLNKLINVGANIFVCYVISYALLDKFGDSITALTTFCFALVYFIPPYIAHKNNWPVQNINKLYIVISIVLIFIATAILSDGFVNIILWAVEAFAALYIGAKINKPYLLKTGLSLLIFTATAILGVKGSINYTPIEEFIPVLNLRFLAFATIIALSILGVEIIKKIEGAADRFSFHINTLRVLWTTGLFVLVTVEINDLNLKFLSTASKDMAEIIKYNKAVTFGVLWAIYGARLISYGINLPVLYFGYFVYFLSIIALLRYGFYFIPLEGFIPILNIRMLGWLMPTAAALFISRLCKKNEFKDFYKYLAGILMFLYLSVEIFTTFDFIALKTDYYSALKYSKLVILSIVWVIYSLLIIKVGEIKKIKPFTILGYTFSSLALIVFLFKGFYFVPLDAFIPILNIRALGWLSMCGAALTLNYWNKKLEVKNGFNYLFCSLLFFFISAEVHTYFNVINDSDMMQLTFSVVWLLFSFALMSVGIWKKVKPYRYFAMGVISFSILKIFLIDLAFVGEFYRIISFICLGIILLGASYMYHRYNKLINDETGQEDKTINIEDREL